MKLSQSKCTSYDGTFRCGILQKRGEQSQPY